MSINYPDLINAVFEFGGGLTTCLSVRLLYKHKDVKGTSILSGAFFMAWGYWNLGYYPHLDQWWSTAAAGFLAVINTVWVVMALYYRRKPAVHWSVLEAPE